MVEAAFWPVVIGVGLGVFAILNVPKEPMFDVKGNPIGGGWDHSDSDKTPPSSGSVPKPTSMKEIAAKEKGAKDTKTEDAKKEPAVNVEEEKLLTTEIITMI